MNTEEFLKSRGFSPGWLEDTHSKKEDIQEESAGVRKDLNVLLAELEEIKNEFEKISQKKEKLKNLLNFYSGFIYN